MIITKTTPVTTFVEEKFVRLDLSIKQAEILMAIVGCIGGTSDERFKMSEIYAELHRDKIKADNKTLSHMCRNTIKLPE